MHKMKLKQTTLCCKVDLHMLQIVHLPHFHLILVFLQHYLESLTYDQCI